MIYFLRIFGFSLGISFAGLATAFLRGGWGTLLQVAILAVLEVSLSFDNALLNAKILERMSIFWQKIFLTIGIIIAVFVMRLICPLLVVGVPAGLTPSEVLNLALDSTARYNGLTYAQHLTAAHVYIAAFGGMFLGMIFLRFLFEKKEIYWLRPLERAGEKCNSKHLPVFIALALLIFVDVFLVHDQEKGAFFVSGLVGLGIFQLFGWIGSRFQSQGGKKKAKNLDNQLIEAIGKQAFFLFLYLEVLDASFSLDGVVGAFAITQNVWVIMAGLGIGALYIRSMTVFLVRKGTLAKYAYLDHGAHYAIGSLALLLFLSTKFEIPDVITGLIGVGFISTAFMSSLIRNKRIHDT